MSRGLWREDGSGWLPCARHLRSPNFDPRPGGMTVELLVVHYISLPPGRFRGDAIERLFTNRLDTTAHDSFQTLRGLRVSAHFLVRRRGELLQFVDADARAWHAGASRFLGRGRCNDFSVGIELEGDDVHDFTEAQYRRLGFLTGALRTRFPLRWIAGHSDIAPGRKHDPGPRFDWTRLLAMPSVRGLIRPGADDCVRPG